jgi:hypothetical protein
MATKKAYVYKVDDVFTPYRVFPPVVVLTRNDKFELVNTVDDHDAVWSVPDGFFEGDSINDRKIGRRSTSGEKTPKSNSRLSTQYAVEVDGKRATGNSDPVIIIDPEP